MMENKEDYYLSLIEKYVNLDLSESELEVVEEKLQSDEDFISAFRLYQESRAIVNEYVTDSAQAWDQDIGLDYLQIRNTGKDSLRGVLLLGFDYYDQNDFENSIEALQDFKAGDLYFEDALLIRGLSNYQLGNREKAIDLLSTLKDFPTGKKANVAKWYLGLIYLSENNELEAGKYIEIPENPDTGIKIIE